MLLLLSITIGCIAVAVLLVVLLWLSATSDYTVSGAVVVVCY
jgi:hypothetical protein